MYYILLLYSLVYTFWFFCHLAALNIFPNLENVQFSSDSFVHSLPENRWKELKQENHGDSPEMDITGKGDYGSTFLNVAAQIYKCVQCKPRNF